jgi:hypothetical protein
MRTYLFPGYEWTPMTDDTARPNPATEAEERLQNLNVKALKFVEDTNTRFLNKARGLITFNGLTLATFGTLIKAGGPTTQAIAPWVLTVGIGSTLVSAVILLWTHFLINFGPPAAYASDQAEFESYIVEVSKKAKWISIAGFLSFVSVLVIVSDSYSWIHVPPEPAAKSTSSPAPPQ